MALTVNSNIQALNAYRNLNKTQSSLSSSLEKLSSGLRINRAADDAAGLAISEGFKAQIGGIQQASKNAQDGVSLVQTADGALSETQTILQRLRTLAVSSANGSQSTTSRTAINAEASSLKAELTRIAQTSNFNGVNLLDGTLKTAASFQIGYRADNAASGIAGNVISVAVDSNSLAANIAAVTATQASFIGGTTQTFSATNYDFTATGTHASLVGSAAVAAFGYDFSTSNLHLAVTFGANAYALTVTANVTNIAGLASALTAQATTVIGANDLSFAASGSQLVITSGSAAPVGTGDHFTVGALTLGASVATDYGIAGAATGTNNAQSFSLVVGLDGGTQTLSLSSSYNTQASFITALNAAASTQFNGANKLTFAASANGLITVAAGTSDSNLGTSSTVQVVSISLGAGNGSVAYGLTAGAATGTAGVAAYTNKAGAFDAFGLGVYSLDLSTQASATAAITSIDTAITNVSNARATLGALQNRFQYTVDNLDTTSENLSSAESRVVDTDMASEMVNYTRATILSQAGTSMLAQAKNLPQSILDLLKS